MFTELIEEWATKDGFEKTVILRYGGEVYGVKLRRDLNTFVAWERVPAPRQMPPYRQGRTARGMIGEIGGGECISDLERCERACQLVRQRGTVDLRESAT